MMDRLWSSDHIYCCTTLSCPDDNIMCGRRLYKKLLWKEGRSLSTLSDTCTLFLPRAAALSLVVASDPGAGTFSSPPLITSPRERAQLPPHVNSTTLRRDLHVHDHFYVHEKSLLSSILFGFARPRVKKSVANRCKCDAQRV